MPGKRSIILLLALPFIAFCFRSREESNVTINLSYSLNYNGDSWEKQRAGFLWALSFLGAELPKGSFNNSINWKSGNIFEIDFNKLGFSKNACEAIQIICDSIKNTGIYKKHNSVELGHFIALTLGTSSHYYKITNVPESFQGFITRHNAEGKKMPITLSSVSKHHRMLTLINKDELLNDAYIAEEGTGNVGDGSFITEEYEVFDIMKNGQLRFIIYDKNGNLVPWGDEKYSGSGKPAKCLWCHEINIQPLFAKADNVPGFISTEDFQKIIFNQNKRLNEYRYSLNSEINFKMLQDHTFTELIYISYMEPTLLKISHEWKMPIDVTKKILASQKTHSYHEFPFLGDLYYRDSVVTKSTIVYGKIPSSVREKGLSEPDFFKKPAR